MSTLAPPSFLNHVPVALAFGTSGLRGLVSDITDLEAFINVKGALRYLLRIGDIRSPGPVLLAGDLRPSTERILGASAAAILSSGLTVEYAGRIPTPALLLHSLTTQCAGVMVTGSHIPFDRNGIKVNKSVGEVLKSDETEIAGAVESVRREEYGKTETESAFDPSGRLKHSAPLPPINRAAEEGYVARYRDAFSPKSLKGIRVLVYQHSAVGRDLLPRILSLLGAEVVTAGRSETFIPIDTENITDAELDALEALAKAAEATGGPLFAIVSTDGDSDRPLVVAVAPQGAKERGRRVRFLPGDLLGLVVAESLSADAVVVPISANDAVERRMAERGVTLFQSRIGSPYVIAGIDALLSEKRYARAVGWESNGGFLLGSSFAVGSGTLAALPTRDAVLPIVVNLHAAVFAGIRLEEVWNRLPARFGRAGLLDHIPVSTSKALLSRLIPPGEATGVEFSGAGPVFDRSRMDAPSIPLSEELAAVWRERKTVLEGYFSANFGFSAIARVNVLDGLRIFFRNGDVAHLRPSGNAPQLRIYANADSQARADQIVEFALREPDGILRRLAKDCIPLDPP